MKLKDFLHFHDFHGHVHILTQPDVKTSNGCCDWCENLKKSEFTKSGITPGRSETKSPKFVFKEEVCMRMFPESFSLIHLPVPKLSNFKFW